MEYCASDIRPDLAEQTLGGRHRRSLIDVEGGGHDAMLGDESVVEGEVAVDEFFVAIADLSLVADIAEDGARGDGAVSQFLVDVLLLHRCLFSLSWILDLAF